MSVKEIVPSEGPYHLRLKTWPSFEFHNPDIDGLVPVCRVESWQAFESLIGEEWGTLGIGDRVYRGHRRYEWQLEDTLTREFDGGAIPPEVSSKLLSRFKLAMRGRGVDLAGITDDENEVWAYGQHFGLATPLLDWTESPFVALFFAFAQEDDELEKQNGSRAVFSLNRGLIDKVIPNLFFEPALGENARLVNQAGLFTVTPTDDENFVSAVINAVIDSGAVDPDKAEDIARYIYKVHIPNTGRADCLSMLRRMNIHHANLFPDPSGASLYCNDWLRREVSDRKRAEIVRKQVASKPPLQPPVEHAPPEAIEGEPTTIEALLNQLIVPDDGIAPSTVSQWAERVAKTYEENSPIDWPVHVSTTKGMRIRMGRLLNALGFPPDRRNDAMDKIVGFYASEYIKKNNLKELVGGPRSGGDFFYAIKKGQAE
ncbi:hypothetical protein ASE66_12600 [Bosea sp. Root483D1]|uniref:FRG domain-containing protein n=1 Tax=Bosea sp. Root483D1 TaxID=1736544 RepID=UPI0007101E4A|nr:FRG domain-containing protein [Bosea sp. Root483D1]KRE14235.1 hypothetical protein ASE66_12600 [Bosea sp. Root483D1]